MSRILFLILLALSGCARNIEEIAIASHEAYDRGDTQRAIAILESANAPTNYLIAPSLAFYYVAQGIAENKVANIERADLILQEVVLPEENRDFARLNITFLRFLAEGNTSKKERAKALWAGYCGRESDPSYVSCLIGKRYEVMAVAGATFGPGTKSYRDLLRITKGTYTNVYGSSGQIHP